MSIVLDRCYSAAMAVVPAIPTRQRMIETAMMLFRRGGFHGTSWRALVEAAGTPWGSAHHHFPGGKEQLGVAAIDMAAEMVALQIQQGFAQFNKPQDGVRAYFRMEANTLEQSDFRDGCPIATVALETTSESTALADACKRAFDRWCALMAERLVQNGVKKKRAAELASILLSTFEGALLVARVSRSTQPLTLAAEQLASLLDAELG